MRTWRVPYQLQILKAGGQERSTGLHLSDIIRDLSLKGGMLDKKYADGPMSPEKIELGIAWEERLAKHHPEICFHPGEVVVDGIPMTIDGVSYADGEVTTFGVDGDGAIHEFKLTWKSMRRDITEEFMWLAQIKGYCRGFWLNNAFLHVYWVNGNYSRTPGDPNAGPQYHIYGLEFTPLEIQENWHMILAHKARMEGTVFPRARMNNER